MFRHGRKAAAIAGRVGEVLGLSPVELRVLTVGALLHDVGKLFLPRSLLRKPGALNASESAVLRTHPLLGARFLVGLEGGIGPASLTALLHHERWDGSGYPFGITGVETPLIARVVAVADAYAAMTSDRPYRKAKSSREALEELRRLSGIHFDPEAVRALQAVLPR